MVNITLCLKVILRVRRYRWKKKENCYLPFVSQSGYGRCVFRSLKFVYLPPFSLIRDFGKQNTRGNVSKISVSLTCYRHIRLKSTNHSPLA